MYIPPKKKLGDFPWGAMWVFSNCNPFAARIWRSQGRLRAEQLQYVISTCHETDHDGLAVAAWAGSLARCESVERCSGVSLAASRDSCSGELGVSCAMMMMMMMMMMFFHRCIFVSQFHHGCDAARALVCLTAQYQARSWFLWLACLLILQHFLNGSLLMLFSIEF